MPGPATTEAPAKVPAAPGPDAEWFYLDPGPAPLSVDDVVHAESYRPVTSR